MKRLVLTIIFLFIFFIACDPTQDSSVVVDASKCLGYTCRICEKVCKYDAIHFYGPESTPVIDPDKCASCGDCVRECPQQAITISGR